MRENFVDLRYVGGKALIKVSGHYGAIVEVVLWRSSHNKKDWASKVDPNCYIYGKRGNG